MVKPLLSRRCLILLFLWCASLLSLAAPGPDAKATDIENIKKIGTALTAYKKVKGEYPDHLCDLVPAFLEAKTLLSPLGVEGDPRAVKREYDPKYPCTYCYEFSTEPFYQSGLTFREIKKLQLEEYGPTLPILRCFLHGRVLNLSHAGDFFETEFYWENDPETERLTIKNGLGPGLQKGKKLEITVTDDLGHPIPGAALATLARSVAGLNLPNRDYVADADGRISIPLGSDPKPMVVFKSKSENWCLLTRRWTFGDEGTPASGEVAAVQIVLHPAATMGGVIRNLDGTPLPDAAIGAFSFKEAPQGEQRSTIAETKSDAQGRWTLKSMPRKGIPFRLVVSHPGLRTSRVQPSATSTPTDTALFAQSSEIQLGPLVPVTGVISCAGQPIPNAKFSLNLLDGSWLKQGTTDASGQFSTSIEDEGKGYLTVFAEDFAPTMELVEVRSVAQPFAIALETGRPLKGRVMSGPRTGAAGVPVLFKSLGMPLSENPVIAITDEEGRFTWKHAPRRQATLMVLPPSGQPVSFLWDTTKNEERVVRIDQN